MTPIPAPDPPPATLDLWAFETTAAGFIPANASRSVRSRLSQFIAWVAEDDTRNLLHPHLAEYKAHLSQRMTTGSVNAHITTVRARYRAHILKSNDARDALYAGINAGIDRDARLRAEVERLGGTKAYVDERLTRLENELSQVKTRKPKRAAVKTDQQKGVWLTAPESRQLLQDARAGKGGDGLTAVRDAAIFTVMMATGLRAAEVCGLKVDDVFQTVDGDPAVYVRDGKGDKARVVPLGGNAPAVYDAVNAWLDAAGFRDGWLFRGFTGRNRAAVRENRMSVRALQYIIDAYPVQRDGDTLRIAPHDLRRTYAKRLHNAGVPLVHIQTLLGHDSLKTTMVYLGVKAQDITVPQLV